MLSTMTIVNNNRRVTKIYESPDGGKTIYVREAGSDLKTLLTRAPEYVEREKAAARANRLLTILALSETDPALEKMIEQIESYYILKYTHEND